MRLAPGPKNQPVCHDPEAFHARNALRALYSLHRVLFLCRPSVTSGACWISHDCKLLQDETMQVPLDESCLRISPQVSARKGCQKEVILRGGCDYLANCTSLTAWRKRSLGFRGRELSAGHTS